MAAFSKNRPRWYCLLTTILVFLTVDPSRAKLIPDTRLCADRECKDTISKARVLNRYPGSDHPLQLSLKPGDLVLIKSKAAGENDNMWGGEVDGHRGYFPRTYVREFSVLVRNPQYVVDTEKSIFDSIAMPSPPSTQRHNMQKQPVAEQDAATTSSPTTAEGPPEMKTEDGEKESNKFEDETEIDETEIPDSTDKTDYHPSAGQTEHIGKQEKVEAEKSLHESAQKTYESAVSEETDRNESPQDRDDTELEDDGDEETEHDADEESEMIEGDEDEENEIFDEDELDESENYLYEPERRRDDTQDLNQFLKDKMSGKDNANGAGEPSQRTQSSNGDPVEQKPEPIIVETEEEVSTSNMGVSEPEIRREEAQPDQKSEVETMEEEEKKDVAAPESPVSSLNERKTDQDFRNNAGSEHSMEAALPGQKDDEAKVENTKQTTPAPSESTDFEKETVVMEHIENEEGQVQEKSEGTVEASDPTDGAKSNQAMDTKNDASQDSHSKADIAINDQKSGDQMDIENDALTTGEKDFGQADSDIIDTVSKKFEGTEENVLDHLDAEVNTEKANESPDKQSTEKHPESDESQIVNRSVDEGGNKPDSSLEKSVTKEESLDSLRFESEKEQTSAFGKTQSVDNSGDVNTELDKEEKNIVSAAVDTNTAGKQDSSDSSVKHAESSTLEEENKTTQAVKAVEATEISSDVDKQEVDEQKRSSPEVAQLMNDNENVVKSSENSHKDEDNGLKDVFKEDEKSDPLSDSFVDLENWQRDDSKPSGGGFGNILQGSRASSFGKEEVTATPKLDIPSSSLSMPFEAVTDASSLSLELDSSKTEIQEVENTDKGGEEPLDKSIQETIVEGGTTIILDATGSFVTAIVPQEAESAVHQETKISTPAVKSTTTAQSDIQATMPQDVPEPSTRPEELHISVDDTGKNATDDKVLPDDSSPTLDGATPKNEVYQSSDFNTRKVLSVNQPSTQQPDAAPEVLPPVEATPATQESPATMSASGEPDDLLAPSGYTSTEDVSKPELTESYPEVSNTQQQNSSHTGQEHTEKEEGNDNTDQINQVESSTSPSVEDLGEIPIPPTPTEPTEKRPPPEGADSVSAGHGDIEFRRAIPVYNKEGEGEEEEIAKSSPGMVQGIMAVLNKQTELFVDKLPTSIQSMLKQEPLGLSPSTVVVLVTVVFVMILSITCSSYFSSDGTKKKLKTSLDLIRDLEGKLQLAVKERENIEDTIQGNSDENIKFKEEVAKMKRDAGKLQGELQTVELHNANLKTQIAALKKEVGSLQETASSKQGEAKQQNKKTKDMEKDIKKLQEREKTLDQENKKLSSELKYKEENLAAVNSKAHGLDEQINHLQTRKDQLLAEADDWKEKVSDLKEQLEQREEEFKHMQENIMFKENELEILKDCFLQLKSFEEKDVQGEEEEDNNSSRVQEKLQSMMDVSKVNAALRASDEEKDVLNNKLKIEQDARKEVEEQLENSRRGVESSMADKMKAERQCQEAQTKLNVLSSYFKEKEMQLQRELGEQEALKKQNLNKLVSADETTRTIQQEMDVLRTQNESLKRELSSSERDFRSQIAANEKKAHENWLSARAAERELKEARHEAGMMRQKLTDIERRQIMGPGGLIRPLPTRGMPPPGMMNGPPGPHPPPPPGMERSPSNSAMPPVPPLHLREDEYLSPRLDRSLPPPMDRRGPPLPPGMRPPHPDARSPQPRMPPFGDARSPPPRMPPPGMIDGRSPPPYDRRPPPPHLLDRRSPPFRLPPPDMMPPMRGGHPPYLSRGGSISPSRGQDSPHMDSRPDGRFPLPPYGRNPPPPSDKPSPRQQSTRQQQSQV